jgi:hypothetical protein
VFLFADVVAIMVCPEVELKDELGVFNKPPPDAIVYSSIFCPIEN